MKFRVILKDDGYYYPQRLIEFLGMPLGYVDILCNQYTYTYQRFHLERDAIEFIEHELEAAKQRNIKKLKAKSYIPKEIM